LSQRAEREEREMKKLIALMAMVFVLTSFGLSYAEEDNIVLVQKKMST
jgi:preprotein translocase subunit SecG